MHPATRTTTKLLDGLFDPSDHTAWLEFDRRYRPIIVRFSRALGLDSEDAADVAQEMLVRFLGEYRGGKYDRSRGRLRSWIIGIARSRVADAMRLRGKAAGQRGVSAIVDVSGDEDLDELWGVQKHRVILRFALQELRATSRSSESTIQAFERLALHGQRPEAVAEELGLTIDDVYQAKTRIASRLREIVQRIEALYDEDE